MQQALYTMIDSLGEKALTPEMTTDWHSGMLCRDQFDRHALNFASDITRHCIVRFESNGDVAARSEDHERAIAQYSVALALHPQKPLDLLVKRSTARTSVGLWEDALRDSDEVWLNSSSCPMTLNSTNAGDRGGPLESVGIPEKTRSPACFAALR